MSRTAVLSSSGSGFQVMDLTRDTFSPALDSQTAKISESFAVDPGRKLVLSPSEAFSRLPPDYQIVQNINSTPALFNFADAATVFAAPNDDLDSAAEDCTTGIAMASLEFTSNVFLTDLSQATFTPGTGGAPGTWNAPTRFRPCLTFRRCCRPASAPSR